jgi:predicted extracellular nuclease
VLRRNDDPNSERILVATRLLGEAPEVTVGSRFAGPLVGVLEYSYGAYKVLLTEPLPAVESAGLEREVTPLVGTAETLTVATMNVENLSVTADEEKYSRLAEVVVRNLRGPDVVALQEVQDDSGSANDGQVGCQQTLSRFVRVIREAGGPAYQWLAVDPENNQDGGMPGGNIRVAYLINPQRVGFDRRGSAGPRDATRAVAGPQLSLNPGRVVPDHPAFVGDRAAGRFGTRKSLALELEFNGRRLFFVNNHFCSKRGDEELFGARQPPGRSTEALRTSQAAAVNSFVRELLAVDSGARVVVLGDLNEHEFRPPLEALKGSQLQNLMESLPTAERYTYLHLGNSQALDHILVSAALAGGSEIDVVHVNAEYPVPVRASDHDPVVARLTVR